MDEVSTSFLKVTIKETRDVIKNKYSGKVDIKGENIIDLTDYGIEGEVEEECLVEEWYGHCCCSEKKVKNTITFAKLDDFKISVYDTNQREFKVLADIQFKDKKDESYLYFDGNYSYNGTKFRGYIKASLDKETDELGQYGNVKTYEAIIIGTLESSGFEPFGVYVATEGNTTGQDAYLIASRGNDYNLTMTASREANQKDLSTILEGKTFYGQQEYDGSNYCISFQDGNMSVTFADSNKTYSTDYFIKNNKIFFTKEQNEYYRYYLTFEGQSDDALRLRGNFQLGYLMAYGSLSLLKSDPSSLSESEIESKYDAEMFEEDETVEFRLGDTNGVKGKTTYTTGSEINSFTLVDKNNQELAKYTSKDNGWEIIYKDGSNESLY
jgi:hypothetical protein